MPLHCVLHVVTLLVTLRVNDARLCNDVSTKEYSVKDSPWLHANRRNYTLLFLLKLHSSFAGITCLTPHLGILPLNVLKHMSPMPTQYAFGDSLKQKAYESPV